VSEWDQRQLCSDGACTGLIGPDGTCKMCGRAAPNWGDERKRGMVEPEDDDEEEDDDEDDEEDFESDASDDIDGEDDDDDEEEAEPGDWKQRKLCSDGACTGVIGDDGKCKVCGKAAA
jgi:hypothetical protein